MNLEAELVLELHVTIGEALDAGETHNGHLRIIPITGGHFKGNGLCGWVIPGGADWNTEIREDFSHVFAKYAIQTDDGFVISIENEGYIEWNRPDRVISTTPRFQVQEGCKYEWLNSGVFAGSLEGAKNGGPAVDIKIYRLK